jgi:hypothetical protein
MARTALVVPVSRRGRLVQKLATLHRQAQESAHVALTRAKEAGALLAPLPKPDRDAIAAEAGFAPRTAQVYVQIFSNWTAIEAHQAQHAAPPLSLRGALQAIGRPERRTRYETYTLDLDRVVPEDVARVLASVAGKRARLSIRVAQPAPDDPMQPGLF